MKTRWIPVLTLLVLFGVMSGLGLSLASAWADEKLAVNTSLKGDSNKGEKVYKTSCQSCHGKGGDSSAGGLKISANFAKPELNQPRIKELLAKLTREQEMMIIKYGGVKSGVKGAGAAMTPFGKLLNDQQIADVAAYLQTFAAFKRK